MMALKADREHPDLITIHTDGSCYPNPQGKGGWAVVAQRRHVTKELWGSDSETTNNRMELTAIREALTMLTRDRDDPVLLFTDSKYAQQCLTVWRHKWVRTAWMNSEAKQVVNRDLIESTGIILDELRTERQVEIAWVRGHAGNILNERADYLAGRARKKQNEGMSLTGVGQ